jgi:hypothetical protein
MNQPLPAWTVEYGKIGRKDLEIKTQVSQVVKRSRSQRRRSTPPYPRHKRRRETNDHLSTTSGLKPTNRIENPHQWPGLQARLRYATARAVAGDINAIIRGRYLQRKVLGRQPHHQELGVRRVGVRLVLQWRRRKAGDGFNRLHDLQRSRLG